MKPGYLPFFVILFFCSSVSSLEIKIERLTVPVKVDESNVGLFNSPIVTFNKHIYVAFVETLASNERVTKIGKYSIKNGWSFAIVERSNMNNPYHAQPSIAIDPYGFIHIVYNMHSSPWQYSISKNPEDISSWVFKGQPLNGIHSQIQSTIVTGKGTASIPGNRISYPYLATDNNGDIYIAYREALKNARKVKYGDRQWSLGISKYNVINKTWHRIGGNNIRVPFASEAGYRPQVAYLSFDRNNRMHVSWNWYVEYDLDGSNKKNVISYAYSDDGGRNFKKTNGDKLDVPLTRETSEKIIEPDFYLSYTKVAGKLNGDPVVLIMPKPPSRKSRSLVSFHPVSGWSRPVDLPYGATDFYIDNDDSIIAISSGVRVHKKPNGSSQWETKEVNVSEGPYTFWMDKSYAHMSGELRILAQSNSNNRLYIYTVTFERD